MYVLYFMSTKVINNFECEMWNVKLVALKGDYELLFYRHSWCIHSVSDYSLPLKTHDS